MTASQVKQCSESYAKRLYARVLHLHRAYSEDEISKMVGSLRLDRLADLLESLSCERGRDGLMMKCNEEIGIRRYVKTIIEFKTLEELELKLAILGC